MIVCHTNLRHVVNIEPPSTKMPARDFNSRLSRDWREPAWVALNSRKPTGSNQSRKGCSPRLHEGARPHFHIKPIDPRGSTHDNDETRCPRCGVIPRKRCEQRRASFPSSRTISKNSVRNLELRIFQSPVQAANSGASAASPGAGRSASEQLWTQGQDSRG